MHCMCGWARRSGALRACVGEEVQFVACVVGRGGPEYCVHVWVRRYSSLHVWLGEEVRSIACMSG